MVFFYHCTKNQIHIRFAGVRKRSTVPVMGQGSDEAASGCMEWLFAPWVRFLGSLFYGKYFYDLSFSICPLKLVWGVLLTLDFPPCFCDSCALYVNVRVRVRSWMYACCADQRLMRSFILRMFLYSFAKRKALVFFT